MPKFDFKITGDETGEELNAKSAAAGVPLPEGYSKVLLFTSPSGLHLLAVGEGLPAMMLLQTRDGDYKWLRAYRPSKEEH